MAELGPVGQIIYEYNQKLDWSSNNGIALDAENESAIHEINQGTAENLGIIFQVANNQFGTDVPLSVALAFVAQESLYDPQCYNHNKKFGNQDNDPMLYDIGICQLNMRYLIDRDVPDRADYATALAFAMNPHTAIPYSYNKMRSDILWAKAQTFEADKDPRASNPYWLASLAYNTGRNGALRHVNEGTIPVHPDRVSIKENYIAQKLSLTPQMPVIKTA